ncbi:MAG: hypothetical protein RMM53_01690 [Bacteroidia bacterium]|nr:hypothetical protein [Bacteroidia bacterium]MDW8332905.1 hypothetical protein [Bacteroidia bacterium]
MLKIALGIWACALCARAKGDGEYIPSVCARFYTETLPNGLRVMVVEDTSREYESLTLVYPGGYDRQLTTKPGLDELTATMAFSEAERHGATDYFWEIRPAYRRFSFTFKAERAEELAAYIAGAPMTLTTGKNFKPTVNKLVRRENLWLDDAAARDVISIFGDAWESAAFKAPAYAYLKIAESDLAESARSLTRFRGALAVFRGPLDHFFCIKIAARHFGKPTDDSTPPPPELALPQEQEHHLASLAPTLMIHAVAFDTGAYRRLYPFLEFLRFRLEHECDPLHGKAALKIVTYSRTVLTMLILERAFFEHAPLKDVFGAADDMARRFRFEYPYRLEARLTDSYLDEYLIEMMLLGRAEDFCRRSIVSDVEFGAETFFNLPFVRIYGLP